MMTNWMRKAVLGTVMAASCVAAAVPAQAQRWGGDGWQGRRWHHRGDRVAAGAILGGLVGLGIGAAVASDARDARPVYDTPPPPPPPPPQIIYRDRYYAPPPVAYERDYYGY